MYLKSLITLFSVAAILGCSQYENDPARTTGRRVSTDVSPPVVLAPGDFLVPTPYGIEHYFYDSSTVSIKLCTLSDDVKLTYLGTHGEYAIAIVADPNEASLAKLKSPLCAQGAPLVVGTTNATWWRQNFIARQNAAIERAEVRRKQVLAAQEILRNR